MKRSKYAREYTFNIINRRGSNLNPI